MRFSSSKYTNYNYKDNYSIYSRGFAPDPTGEDYSATLDPISGFQGPLRGRGEEGKGRGEEEREREKGKGRAGQGVFTQFLFIINITNIYHKSTFS